MGRGLSAANPLQLDGSDDGGKDDEEMANEVGNSSWGGLQTA